MKYTISYSILRFRRTLLLVCPGPHVQHLKMAGFVALPPSIFGFSVFTTFQAAPPTRKLLRRSTLRRTPDEWLIDLKSAALSGALELFKSDLARRSSWQLHTNIYEPLSPHSQPLKKHSQVLEHALCPQNVRHI